jgi:tRNA (guanine37-N1)-methyltransferase
MIKFDIITIFPEIFDSYFKASLIDKAQKKKLIKVKVHDLRKWTKDRHKTVDDRPYGGGLGMVLKVEPIFRAVSSLAKFKIQSSKFKITDPKTKIILFTPRGKKFNQKMAYNLSKLEHIIMICGRYEGVDERVAKKIADLELSIGGYDLMGGELPALVVVETVSRLIPGVLGKEELLKERITKERGFIEYPQYTRPEVFSPRLRSPKRTSAGKTRQFVKWRVPKVLLSGNHKEIKKWREKRAKVIKK